MGVLGAKVHAKVRRIVFFFGIHIFSVGK